MELALFFTNNIKNLIGFFAVLCFALWFAFTLEEPDVKIDNLRFGVDSEMIGNITQVTMTEELKENVAMLQESGFIVKFMPSSHEAWVDPILWASMTLDEKKGKIQMLSDYLKARDGTAQIIIRDGNSDQTVADFFTGSLNIY